MKGGERERHRIVRHGVVDSTNERAFAALASGEALHGDLHVAVGQTAGRGRLGRTWESPAGESLAVSLVLTGPEARALRPAAIPMAAGVAVRAVLAQLGATGLVLKWPNDVLRGDAKLCGILAEARSGGAPGGSAASIVLGVGVNVRQRTFSPVLLAERPVTSLLLAGVDTTPDLVLDALVPHLDRRLDQAAAAPDALASDYLDATGLRGRAVTVRVGEREHRGTLAGLDLAGGLRLRGTEGEARFPLEHVAALAARR